MISPDFKVKLFASDRLVLFVDACLYSVWVAGQEMGLSWEYFDESSSKSLLQYKQKHILQPIFCPQDLTAMLRLRCLKWSQSNSAWAKRRLHCSKTFSRPRVHHNCCLSGSVLPLKAQFDWGKQTTMTDFFFFFFFFFGNKAVILREPFIESIRNKWQLGWLWT